MKARLEACWHPQVVGQTPTLELMLELVLMLTLMLMLMLVLMLMQVYREVLWQLTPHEQRAPLALAQAQSDPSQPCYVGPPNPAQGPKDGSKLPDHETPGPIH